MRVSLTLKPNSRPDFGFQTHWDSTGARVKFIQPGKTLYNFCVHAVKSLLMLTPNSAYSVLLFLLLKRKFVLISRQFSLPKRQKKIMILRKFDELWQSSFLCEQQK